MKTSKIVTLVALLVLPFLVASIGFETGVIAYRGDLTFLAER